MNILEKIEKDIMAMLLVGESDVMKKLRYHYENVFVCSVEDSGCGAFFSYSYQNVTPSLNQKDFSFGDVVVTFPESGVLIGSVLFIENGFISRG